MSDINYNLIELEIAQADENIIELEFTDVDASAFGAMAIEAAREAKQSEINANSSALQALSSAESASDSAETSEAYATGMINGENVDPSHSAYQNNSKYYSEQASTSASQAEAFASQASTSASQASVAASHYPTILTDVALDDAYWFVWDVEEEQYVNTGQKATGEKGEGVPTGGTTGQVLVKKSGTDFDTEWADQKVETTTADMTYSAEFTETGFRLHTMLSNARDLNTLAFAGTHIRENGRYVITHEFNILDDDAIHGAITSLNCKMLVAYENYNVETQGLLTPETAERIIENPLTDYTGTLITPFNFETSQHPVWQYRLQLVATLTDGFVKSIFGPHLVLQIPVSRDPEDVTYELHYDESKNVVNALYWSEEDYYAHTETTGSILVGIFGTTDSSVRFENTGVPKYAEVFQSDLTTKQIVQVAVYGDGHKSYGSVFCDPKISNTSGGVEVRVIGETLVISAPVPRSNTVGSAVVGTATVG